MNDARKEVQDAHCSQKQLANLSCADFASLLAAKTSVPGGGSAAAYTGALACALASMALNFTLGKAAYAEYETELKDSLEQSERLRHICLNLMQDDADALYPLTLAYSIPKDNEGRNEILEEAQKHASEAPAEMMRVAASIIELLEELAYKVSRLLISDVLCALELTLACMQTAKLNVFVNTAAFRSNDWAQKLESESERLLETYSTRANTLIVKLSDSYL